MIVKVCQFKSRQQGERLVEVFQPGEMEKAASFFSMGKTASPLLPSVRDLLENIRPDPRRIYILVNALGAGEYWGCFPDGALVQTSTGERPIESVEIGELVTTHQNRLRRVIARRTKRATELCDLYVRCLPSISPTLTATPNHELYVVLRDDFIATKRRTIWKADTSTPVELRRVEAMRQMEFSWVPISDLRPGDMIAEPFPLEEDSGALGDAKWNTPEVAFLMGLYAAEGCVAYRYGRDCSHDDEPEKIVYVTSRTEDATHAEAVRCAAKLGHITTPRHEEETHSTRMVVCIKELAKLCLLHIGSPAPDKYLSSAILRMPRAWQQVFFDAYAGGDGSVSKASKDAGTIRCVSASAVLLRDFRLLLARLGLAAAVNGRHNKKATWYTGKPIFDLQISSKQLDGTGSPKSYIHPDGYILSAVAKVEQYAWEGDVHDLTVEEDQSFVVNGVVAHNSNINADYFPEAALIHQGPVYGYETFRTAGLFKHHVNKDITKSFGNIMLSAWHDHMKRVELVIEIDRDIAARVGATDICDKLDQGIFFDVSMGCKVPFDTCSICLDVKRYEAAKAAFDPSIHKSPGEAILAEHKRNPIRGVSITRNDYCEDLRKRLNKILPDGRKVYAINDFPRFFDISAVFIGADKTAKVMAKLASRSFSGEAVPSWQVAEEAGYTEEPMEKAASVGTLLPRIKSASEIKAGEIIKDVVPSQFGGKAVPAKDDLPNDVLDTLGKGDLSEALSTPTMMGMLLRPREFQRITIISMGNKPLADDLDEKGIVFPHSHEEEPMEMGSGHFSDVIKNMLMPFMEGRSSLEPVAKRRAIRITIMGGPKEDGALQKVSHHPFMQKIAAAYNGYLCAATKCMQDIPAKIASDSSLWGAVHSQGIGSSFYKVAEPVLAHVVGAALAGEVLSNLAARDRRGKEIQGMQAGMVQELIAEHPHALATLAALGALHAEGSSLPKDLLAKLTMLGKKVLSR